jgi:methyl-accepting chemotaxis protein
VSEQHLPTPRELRLRVLVLDTVVSLPVLAIAFVYISSLLEVTPKEWRCFGWATLGYGLLAMLGFEPVRRRVLSPVYRYSQARGDGAELPPQEVEAAFRAALTAPQALLQLMLASWLVAAVTLPPLVWCFGFRAWLSAERVTVVLAAGVTGGFISSVFMYFLSKRVLAPLRDAAAAEIPDPERRGQLLSPMPISRKLQWVVAGSGFASLLFTMGLTYSRAGASMDALAADWLSRVLIEMESRVDHEDLAAVRQELRLDSSLAPYPVDFEVVEPSRTRVGDEAARALLELVAEGRLSGTYAGTGSPRLLAWRSLPDGSVLVASIPRAFLRGRLSDLRIVLGVVLVAATGLSLAMAWLLALDVSSTARGLRAEVERVAQGDLRRGWSLESDDELGDLARSFERMGGALRATVGRVALAADRVEGTAGQIAQVSESVAAASADQVRRLQRANDLMLAISGQVNEVASSAQALNVSVEESSSSILELGAAGEELNETASILSAKVEEVSSSIGQMVRSVKQVTASSEALSEAATETSSSMEEMASAMRVVDTTAEKTAELSRGVVANAEDGQEKVHQTISGMEAIRDATDTAERVIGNLGARTKEIGAILDVIDDVADETNLLALNAAIIAAQAGEQGRAFSVVADEIKELADRVLASTKEIGTLIGAVQEESANAEGAIEAGSRSVASGVELSAQAGVSLEEITASSRESGMRIGEIVTAVREQTKAASRVVELMERVRHGVDQILGAGAEQSRGNEVIHRSSLTMSEVSQQVRRTTEEQARGFVRIRENVEGVREAVEQINSSLHEQSGACGQVAEFLEQVFERTRSNEEAGQRMGEAMRDLLRQAEALREDVERFRI